MLLEVSSQPHRKVSNTGPKTTKIEKASSFVAEGDGTVASQSEMNSRAMPNGKKQKWMKDKQVNIWPGTKKVSNSIK